MELKSIDVSLGRQCFICKVRDAEWEWTLAGNEKGLICSSCKSMVLVGGKTGKYSPTIHSKEQLENCIWDGYLEAYTQDIALLQRISQLEGAFRMDVDISKERIVKSGIIISALEHLLGFKCIREDKGGVNLTVFGRELLRRCGGRTI